MLILISVSLLTIPVFAGTGSLRIDPPLPEGSGSPATFAVWVQPPKDANDPHIFLVITESCYSSLTGDVEVKWDGSITPIAETDWNGPENDNSDKLPPGTTNGAGYTVASLKDHLNTDGPIYWYFVGILNGEAIEVGDFYEITVDLPSAAPEMLVYILGKSKNPTGPFDMRVPPTIPGFMVPELPLGTITGLVSMIGALLLIVKRPKFK